MLMHGSVVIYETLAISMKVLSTHLILIILNRITYIHQHHINLDRRHKPLLVVSHYNRVAVANHFPKILIVYDKTLSQATVKCSDWTDKHKLE